MTEIEVYPDREALAAACAAVLARALAGSRPRSFAATGGSSPGPVYDALTHIGDLDWTGVAVTLTDDRWVDPRSPLSNEGQVRARLLARAASAAFVPLKGQGATPHADAAAVEPAIARLLPFDAVLLGMGPDGHIASLFPADPDLTAALDPAGERLVVGVDQAGLDPRVPRISLTARALLDARLIVLLATGEDKRALIEGVLKGGGPDYPVAAILRQTTTPVRIMWAA